MLSTSINRRSALALMAGMAGGLVVATRSGAVMAAKQNTLVITSCADAVTLDPQSSFDGQSPLIWRGVYENLLAYKGGSQEIVPNLADYEVSPDGLVYTFKVKDGIKFTDGEVLDAAAVKFNIERQKAINLGIAFALTPIASVETPDEKTVVLKLSAPSDGLLSAFASTIKGTHKPGFAEMKAYNMLNERMDKFAKLPPIMGRRAAPNPNMTGGNTGSPDGGQA